MALEVFAHLTVRPGQLEGFKRQAAECIRITKAQDTRRFNFIQGLEAAAAGSEAVHVGE